MCVSTGEGQNSDHKLNLHSPERPSDLSGNSDNTTAASSQYLPLRALTTLQPYHSICRSEHSPPCSLVLYHLVRAGPGEPSRLSRTQGTNGTKSTLQMKKLRHPGVKPSA